MRVALVGLALLGAVTEASAADLGDILRGSTPYVPSPPTYFRWEGFYGGAQIGYGNINGEITNGVSSLISFMLRNTNVEQEMNVSTWKLLQNQNRNGQSYGVFAGYNSQWDDVILGIEATYNRASFAVSDTNSMSRIQTLSDGNVHTVTVSGTAGMNITDYGTLRGRAGYVMGRFLPYATLGVAVGRASVTQSARVIDFVTTPAGVPVPNIGLDQTLSTNKTAFPWGYAAGAGVDIALIPGVMLRAEYELVQFGMFNDMRALLQTVRVGAGVKF